MIYDETSDIISTQVKESKHYPCLTVYPDQQ